MKTTRWLFILLMMIMTVSCGVGSTPEALGDIIHILIDTQKVKGARVYWRVESQTEEVNSTIRFLLGNTPYRETKNLSVPGLTKENMADVNIVIEVRKRGFHSVVERFNMTSVMADKRIGKVFPLYKKTYSSSKYTKKKRKKVRKQKKVKKQPVAKEKTPTPVKKDTQPIAKDVPQPYPIYSKPLPKKDKTKEPVVEPQPVIIKIENDIYEPNNSADKAKAVYLNREYLAKMDNNSDLDHYMIFLSEKAKYKLILDQLVAGAKYQLEIMTYPKKIETVYKLTTAKEKEELSISLKDKGKATGIYCVKVSYISGKTGAYRLKIELDK